MRRREYARDTDAQWKVHGQEESHFIKQNGVSYIPSGVLQQRITAIKIIQEETSYSGGPTLVLHLTQSPFARPKSRSATISMATSSTCDPPMACSALLGLQKIVDS
jgi:hypothetical protein